MTESNLRILTVRQPWASAIAYGIKDVENRDWVTSYRGPVAIHAGLTVDRSARSEHPHWFETIPADVVLPTGVIIAVVDLVDVVRDYPSRWAAEGAMHWVLMNVRMLTERIPFKGALGLQHLSAAATAAVYGALPPEGQR